MLEANTTSTATIGGSDVFSIKEHQVKPLIPGSQDPRNRGGEEDFLLEQRRALVHEHQRLERHNPVARLPQMLVGEGERVLVGVKKKAESTVLFFDEIKVLARAIDLENSVPIEVVVGDWLLGNEEDVDDGQDLVGAFEEQLGFLREAP